MLFRASSFYQVVLLAAVCNGIWYPGHPTPDFSVPTLHGKHFTNTDIPSGQRPPIMFHRLDERSLFLQAEWKVNSSVTAFVKEAPDATHFVFFASQNSKENVQRLRERIARATRVEGKEELLDRCHFVPVPPESVTPWISEIFQQWKCVGYGCHSHFLHFTKRHHFKRKTDDGLIFLRLDARFDFLPSPKSLYDKTLPVVLMEDTCKGSVAGPEFKHQESGNVRRSPPPWVIDESWTPPIVDRENSHIAGKVIVTSSKGCSYYAKVKYAGDNGAVGVVVYAAEDETVNEIDCVSKFCRSASYKPLNTPATMISAADGKKLKALLRAGSVNVEYKSKHLDHFFFGSDHFGNLAEGGWFMFPSLVHLAYQAKWFEYTRKLKSRIARATKAIPIFVNHQMTKRIKTTITLPDYDRLRHYARAYLHLDLKCPGRFDLDCATWNKEQDPSTALYVCCNGNGKDLCDYELARYFQPFHRGIGQSITDVTPLLPLLNSYDGTCTFDMGSSPFEKPWDVTIKLLLYDSAACLDEDEDCENSKDVGAGKPVNRLAPESLLPAIIHVSRFDGDYNNRPPLRFRVPKGTLGVRLVVVISGMGLDSNLCGMLCVSEHVFTVNKKHNVSITLSAAGTPHGCADQVLHGVVPNQKGGWYFGRGGYCQGQDVKLRVFDISDHVKVHTTNTILYQGYYNGRTPNPRGEGGKMWVRSELVFYNAL